jgi:myosin-5
MSATYDVGTKAWQTDPTEGWVASEVEQKIVDGEKVQLVFQLENGEVLFPPNQPMALQLQSLSTR